jgi:LPXTG-site transpeptidase (sortase) family protein
MIFPVFFSLAASAININPVIAAENSIISKDFRINPISGDQTRLNGPGKEIQFQQACTDDVYEFDNGYLQAKTITTDGIPQSHNNHPATEEDWVTFHAIAGDQYEIGTRLTNDINQSDSGANDTLLYLYAPDGVTQLAFNDDVGDFNWYMGNYHYRESLITWTAPSTGDYYVRELQWGPTVGYEVRDCHTYNMWVIDMTTTPILALSKTSTTGSVTFAGQVIPYTYQLTNNTNATLTGIVLNDNKTVPSCPQTNLAVGGSMVCTASYTVTQADMNAGGFLTNSVNARYDPDIVISNHLDIPIIQNRSLTMVKSITNGDPYSVVSGIIDYSYNVTNNGNVSLAGPVTVTDDQAAAVSCPNVNTIGNLNANLDPGETLTCTASHTVTQGDLDAGSVTNHATAHAAGINSNQASKTATATQSPALGIEKSVTETGYSTGGTVLHYSYKVTNSGNVTLSGPFTVTDDKATDGACPVTPTLAPGSFITCTASYTITQGDLDSGSVTNIASAHGSFGGSPVDSMTDTKTIYATQNPLMTVKKSSLTSSVSITGIVDYDYLVTNTGNVTLTGISLSDNNDNDDMSCPSMSLAPEANMTCTATHTVIQAEIDAGGNLSNTVTASSDQTGNSTDHLDIPITQSPGLSIEKNGALDMTVIAPDDVANVGDAITYTFTLQNMGNVTLTSISVSDPRLPALSCTISSLAPGTSSGCAATSNKYTLTQSDIDNASVSNTAVATGKDPQDTDISGSDSVTVTIAQSSVIGLAKRMVGDPVEVSPGTWDVTFEFLLKNYGNVALSSLQLTDDLTLSFPAPTTFTVRSVTSPSFTVNWSSPAAPTDFDGVGNLNLLTGIDTLAVGGQGTITMVIRIVPASAGPFENSAAASGSPPLGSRVVDVSSDGTDPDHTINCSAEDSCINGDGNPNNNTKPTPVIFVENLFDPPFGVKSVNSSGLPELAWNMVWINGSNIVAQNAAVFDPIPVGTTYVDGSLTCVGASILTTTDTCVYEIPSVPYPLGRVVWTGTIGPDLGATDAASAINELIIKFKVKVNSGVKSVRNMAGMDADLNGDGDTTDPGELQVASAGSSWTKPPIPPEPTPTPSAYGFIIPVTGFAPDRETSLPSQTTFYTELGDLWLEIPRLGVQMPIVGIPQTNGTWDVSWLGRDAGWLNGSAFPTWNGNSVLTGHVTDASGNPGPFARLNTLWWGDKVIVHISGAQYIYEVRSILQSSPANSAAMMKHEELPWVTLVTCRGYDVSSNSYLYRVLVRAVLVEVR